MDSDKFTSSAVSVLARVAGMGFCIVGGAFVLWALISEEDRWFHAIVGIVSMAIGIALLAVEPMSADDVKRVRNDMEGK